MRRAALAVWFVCLLAIGGTAWWYLFAPGSVPQGQPALGDEAAFEKAFRAGVDKKRLVAVLSPTTPADLATAQYLQALLMEYENDPLEVHVVWQRTRGTDWAPTTDAMARMWDSRVRQYWDKENKIRAAVGEGVVFLYARGAGLAQPAARLRDWKTDAEKIRENLGPPAKEQRVR